MNEIKSVKVDNWGVFFLQKLQNFFNRTDHCDLTLQFNDNSQLKVHRLVLSACTDYFNLLEQQCEMVEDILVMPDDLQADVIVPIVNFMYTGTLEFQYSMFDKLLKTANDMNMTVLLKLLEAHRSATRNIKGQQKQPVLLNKQAPRVITSQTFSSSPAAKARTVSVSPQQARTGKQDAGKQKVIFKHHQTTIKPLVGTKMLPEPVAVIAKYSHQGPSVKGPTRFEMDEISGEGFEGQFDSISYESKPLLTAKQIKKEEESSLFERLKKDVNLKRPAASTLSEPTAKKLNLEDVKELTENIRLRKQLAGNEGAEDDPDEYYDDDDDDDEDWTPAKEGFVAPSTSVKTSTTTAVVKPASKTSPKTTISIKEDGSNVNHAKIISEVLKKYPHLVRNNKNIKLKILQKSPEPTAKATPPTAKVYPTKIAPSPVASTPNNPKLVQKISPQVKSPPSLTAVPSRPKRIDTKTMHELIAKGAENTTGPWLCLKCGVDGRPISIPSYKSFRNHLIAVHKEKVDARLCEECGFRSSNRTEVHYHALTKHEIQPPKEVKFPSCAHCTHVAMTEQQLQKHVEEEHKDIPVPVKMIQQCAYCNKVFLKETTLNTHIKTFHRDQIFDGFAEEGYVPNNPNPVIENKGIKIISNISLPPAKALPIQIITSTAQGSGQLDAKQLLLTTKLEPSSEAEALSNVASGITTSLTLVGTPDIIAPEDQFGSSGDFIAQPGTESGAGTEARIVTADGSELQLSAAQKEEILSQLQAGADGRGNVIMVLNHENFTDPQATVVSSGAPENPPSASSNIMVVYSDAPATETTQTAPTTSAPEQILASVELGETLEEPKEMKKENSEPEGSKMEDGETEKAKQSLISTLQGDWSDDEEADEAHGSGSPALFEDGTLMEGTKEGVDSKKVEDDDHETDAKIADAVGDLLSELEGDFKEKEKGEAAQTTLTEEIKEETDDKEKDELEKKLDGAETEICKLVDEWDDDL